MSANRQCTWGPACKHTPAVDPKRSRKRAALLHQARLSAIAGDATWARLALHHADTIDVLLPTPDWRGCRNGLNFITGSERNPCSE